MKSLVALPFALLAIVACSDTNTPTSPASANFAPRADFAAASLGSTYNFEGDFGASASPFLPSRTDIIPSDTYAAGGKGYLGKFTNETVTMTTDYVGGGYINFSLYTAGTWDGLAKGKYGPDTWQLAAYCGADASGTFAGDFTTSFSNKSTTDQSYPDALGVGVHDGLTGAADIGQLGLADAEEVRNTNRSVSTYSATYTMSFQYPAECVSAGQVTWVFSNPTGTMQSSFDEFWGIDNVSVTATSLYSNPRSL